MTQTMETPHLQGEGTTQMMMEMHRRQEGGTTQMRMKMHHRHEGDTTQRMMGMPHHREEGRILMHRHLGVVEKRQAKTKTRRQADEGPK